MTLGRLLWACLPAARPAVLRLFGARVGRGCRFAGSVEIVIPWNLDVGDGVDVGERVILYALGPIALGDGVVIDFAAHLCAGSHDIAHPAFPQTRPPIAVGAGTFIGVDAFIGPGVTLGRRCIVHPRASVHTSFGDGAELSGNPARPLERGGR
jgi:putative colanic acid biosynthesis acetyltransferase WcaF